MTMVLKMKRGNTAQCKSYLAQPGEPFVDTQALQLRIGDGITMGGNIVLNIVFGPHDQIYAQIAKDDRAIALQIPAPEDWRNRLPMGFLP